MLNYRLQTGGKLYLTGEYAILEPGQLALIQFIPLMMTAEIGPSSHLQLASDMFDHKADMTSDASYGLIQATVKTFANYMGQSVEQLAPFSLSITGKLERDGKKFGIGSSGSVTLLTLKALSAYYQQPLSPELLFKLAAYTLLARGDNGSMGDIACIAYQTLVAYTSFDRQQVSQWLSDMPLRDLLAKDWGYQIQVIEPALSCDFLVGWTKIPSISSQMIQQVKAKISPSFLTTSYQLSQETIAALQSGHKEALKTSLTRVSQLLKTLDPAIYHPKLVTLVEACQGLDAVAKSSGSGGGDCGIALAFDSQAKETLITRWQAADIDLLYQERWGNHDES
ncbi:phosphomevalonate kinase [Streptococcus dysgalactiae]|uniref:phosphomevalonate kinase n=1 Tax=Streptococcus dysgalactiae TaxID=1334 RepID=UPI001C4A9CC4|nr:phosphomevalonate kinase [Streptococcus dysgalactiae]